MNPDYNIQSNYHLTKRNSYPSFKVLPFLRQVKHQIFFGQLFLKLMIKMVL